MAKSTGEGPTKRTSGETKARRAPVGRRTTTKKEGAVASAPDAAASEVVTKTEPETPAMAAAPSRRAHGAAPSREEIQRLAYELYVRRRGADGSQLEDWYEAERLLRARGR